MKLIAKGNTAEVFEYGEDKVLKLFKPGYPVEQIQREFNNTVIMNRICVHTPKAFEIVEHAGRHGIVFQKIIGVDLFSEYLKNPSDEKIASVILTDLSDIQKKFCWKKQKKEFPIKFILNGLDMMLQIFLMEILFATEICIPETLSGHRKMNCILLTL